jgi:membrane protease YdiL (CAAX protease family)
VNWLLAAAAPTVLGLVFLAFGRIHPAMLADHALCAVAIFRHRARIRVLLPSPFRAWRGGLGTLALFLPFLVAGPFVLDPAPYREVFRRTLFLSGEPPVLFLLFAAYTLLLHVPLEEIFWRGVVLDPERAGLPSALAGSFLFFGALHAVPLGLILGPVGLLLSLPAAAAGALWAALTIRTRSLWPALVSHWGSDLIILGGMWFYFIR